MLRRWSIAGISLLLLTGLGLVITVPRALATTGTGTTIATVTVYSGPGDANTRLRTIAAHTKVSFTCYVVGESVTSVYGTENFWDSLAGGGYAPDELILTGHNYPVVPKCPSAQFGVGRYPVAFSGGAGAQPYRGTSISSGPDGSGLPDGKVVSVSCETTGEAIADAANLSTKLWDRLASGGYIPNAYLNTEVNGATPGLPTCAQSGSGGSGSAAENAPALGQAAPVASNPVAGGAGGSSTSCPRANGSYHVASHGGVSVPLALYDHYVSGTGTPVVIDWSFFSQSAPFVAFAKGIPVGQAKYYRDGATTSTLYALGDFQVVRTSRSCFAIYDHYDFTSTKALQKGADSVITLPAWAEQLAGAWEFYEQGAGSL